MTTIVDKVLVDISVVLGSTAMPIHQLLRMGRGAVIELGVTEDDSVTILANDHPIATGIVSVNGNRVGVTIQEFFQMPVAAERIALD